MFKILVSSGKTCQLQDGCPIALFFPGKNMAGSSTYSLEITTAYMKQGFSGNTHSANTCVSKIGIWQVLPLPMLNMLPPLGETMLAETWFHFSAL